MSRKIDRLAPELPRPHLPYSLQGKAKFDSFPMFSHDGAKLVFASNRDPDKPRATDIYLADYSDVK